MSSARFRCTTTNIRKIAEIANLNSLFLVKRKTRQKAAPYEPVNSHLLSLSRQDLQHIKPYS